MKPLPIRRAQVVDCTTVPPAEDIRLAMDRPVERKRWRPRSLVITGVLICIALALAALYMSSLRNSGTLQISHATFSPVTYSAFLNVVPVEGRLVPEKTVYVDSVEGGRVVSVHVEAGEKVLAGAPLATLKNPDIELRVMASEAQYAEQVSNLARAQIEFDQTGLQYAQQLADIALQIDLATVELSRYENPEKTGIARSVVERIELQLEHHRRNYQLVAQAKEKDERGSSQNLSQLQSSVGRMKLGLDIQRRNLDALAVVAPISGLLTDFDISVGEVISPGERLGHVDETDAFNIRANVDEFYLARLFAGQAATATLDGVTFKLEIQKIYPNIENRQFQVELAFTDTPPADLRVGQNLRVRIQAGAEEDVLAIPNGVYLDASAGDWVFVKSTDGKSANRRNVKLGRRNNEIVEVVGGLFKGDVVLTSNYELLAQKETVKLVSD